jgi:hypothetical protein
MKITEHQHQVSVIQWFGMQYPKLLKNIFAIPNGAHLAGDARIRAIKMKKLKDEGFKTGVSDLFLMKPMGQYMGMFIEMKSLDGKLQADQEEFLNLATSEGYYAVACYGFLEAKDAITFYLQGAK